MQTKTFLAIDIGATSGRSIIGTLDNNIIELKELTRFPNKMVQINNHFYWNIYSLYDYIKEALHAARNKEIEIYSLGIDTWGVDFALIAKDGTILGLPHAYRDPQTEGMPHEFFNLIPKKRVYHLTGIQVMNFNSIYQLFALKNRESSLLAAAESILFMPNALAYLLTGKKVTEYTIASTSQILNPRTKKFEPELLEALNLSPTLLGDVEMPGNIIGTLSDFVADECRMANIKVIAVAGHDTASAIAAIPATNERFAYLSSGTWSLMGIETKEPIINDETYSLNFTNEGGIDGTTRFLKNITGMWLLEQCLKEWQQKGLSFGYQQIIEMAQTAPAFQSLFDPDHCSFANPKSMTLAIANYCKVTRQNIPSTPAEFTRSIFESLVLKYNEVLITLKKIAPFAIEKLHVIGGGSKNKLLNQWTANALGICVIARPAEATAIGNIMIQARAAGLVDTLTEIRLMVKNSIELDQFLPENREHWQIGYSKFLSIIEKNNQE